MLVSNTALFAYIQLLYKPAATRWVSIADLMTATALRTYVVQFKGKFSRYFTEADTEAVAGCRFDFVLRCAYNIKPCGWQLAESPAPTAEKSSRP